MQDEATSPLQQLVAELIARSGRARDHWDTVLRSKLDTKGKPLYDITRGKSKNPSGTTIAAIAEVFGISTGLLTAAANGSPVDLPTVGQTVSPDHQSTRSIDQGETVEIIQLDLSLPMGPGATVDDYIEEEPRLFDLSYIRSFTRTPPARLRLARGVGDSMFPTLLSNDLVWIDSTQTNLNQSDRIWAVSINGGAAIKRLRPLKGGRVLVLSDNPGPGHEAYEVGADEIMIGGRVIRFARDV